MLVGATTKEGYKILINIHQIAWIADELNGYLTVHLTNRAFLLIEASKEGLSATEKLLNNLYRRS